MLVSYIGYLSVDGYFGYPCRVFNTGNNRLNDTAAQLDCVYFFACMAW